MMCSSCMIDVAPECSIALRPSTTTGADSTSTLRNFEAEVVTSSRILLAVCTSGTDAARARRAARGGLGSGVAAFGGGGGRTMAMFLELIQENVSPAGRNSSVSACSIVYSPTTGPTCVCSSAVESGL